MLLAGHRQEVTLRTEQDHDEEDETGELHIRPVLSQHWIVDGEDLRGCPDHHEAYRQDEAHLKNDNAGVHAPETR